MKVFTAVWLCESGSNDWSYDPEVVGVYSSKTKLEEAIRNFIIQEIDSVREEDDPEIEEMELMNYEELLDYYEDRMDAQFFIKTFEIDDNIKVSI